MVLLFDIEHKHFTIREAYLFMYSTSYVRFFAKFELRNLSDNLMTDKVVLMDISDQSFTSSLLINGEELSSGGVERRNFAEGATALRNESGDWNSIDLSEMPRNLHSSCIQPFVGQVQALQAKHSTEIHVVTEALKEPRDRLSAILQEINALNSTGDINTKRSAVEQLLNMAAQQEMISDSQRLEIEAGFKRCSEILKQGKKKYTKNRYVKGPGERKKFEIFDHVAILLVVGIPALLVGLFFSMFFDTAIFWTMLIATGVIVYEPLIYAGEKSFDKAQSRQLSESSESLKQKVLTILRELESRTQLAMDKLKEEERATIDNLKVSHKAEFRDLEKTVSNLLANFGQTLAHKKEGAGFIAADWGAKSWASWEPADQVPETVRIGGLSNRLLEDSFKSVSSDIDISIEMPALMGFPTGAPLNILAKSEIRSQAIQSVQSIIARLLATTPPGKLRFTFIDPVGLGQNISAFMPLGDYDESLITSRVWSEPEHIDKRLKELTEHLENVIQKYLRHEFKTIEDYNRQAHEVAEPYRVLVVFDFPANFTESSARRLVSLVQNGPRCGVYPIVLSDVSQPLPYGFFKDDLYQSMSNVWYESGRFLWDHRISELMQKADNAQKAENGSMTNKPLDVVLVACGENKIAVIKAVRAVTGLDLVEAKMMVESPAFMPVKHAVEKKEAEAVKKTLEESGATVSIIASSSEMNAQVGRTYQGQVSRIMDFGAFVTILPGHDGLVHISQISEERVDAVSEKLAVGDVVRVKVLEVDAHGRIRLTMKGVEEGSDVPIPLQQSSSKALSISEAFTLELDAPCPPELLNRIIKEVGEAAKDNMTVVVPYAKVLSLAGLDSEYPQGWWKAGGLADGHEESSAESVQIPLGPMGARKAQSLTLGKGTAHHALIAGRTGSGKSNLLHVIITTLAVKYSPREIELYLIDFKKGVEFKSYANHALPHARVIAIESEREFGLSVLQGLDTEMQRRGETFRGVAANDLAEYREKTNTQLPRLILIVDEFQEFFSEDDATARQAASILDRLVRQGRSFGIHILLGSQSLAGSYTLARSTLDQMQIRIALPCSEADSRLILADDNPAARLLSRPGEAIYNASSGLIEGNHIFQVALFSDEDREYYLQAIAQKAGKAQRQPIVFEGHESAAIEACESLAELLAAPHWPPVGKSTEVWLGEPVAITSPTSVRFRRQGGANLLVVTREEEEGVGLLSACVLSLTAQHHPDTVKLYIIDLATADALWSELAGDLADLLPHRIEVLGRRDIPGLLTELTSEIQHRINDEQVAKAWNGYLIIQGLHRARDLRIDPAKGYSFSEQDNNTSPTEQFSTILREGPEVGIHTLVWCDTYLNLDRTLEPRALVEFGYRVAGTMTQDDSMRLLDDAAAARLDRPHRMIKYDEDKVGVLEKFRPYRMPTTAWLETAAETLRNRLS